MDRFSSWQYDEMQQIGKDYDDRAEVAAYDERHGKFRDVTRENEAILTALCLKPEHLVIEFGPGTGAFALQAAQKCAWIYAVDISRAMLEYAKEKADRAGITNIKFCHAGFLTYTHTAAPADAIVTNTAFHHLPDFWKGVALERMGQMLRPRGMLYLSDIIFERSNVSRNIEQFVAKMEKAAGPGIRKDIEAHIRTEFSTYDWVLDGLLERAGFEIINKTMLEGVIGRYLCRIKGNGQP